MAILKHKLEKQYLQLPQYTKRTMLSAYYGLWIKDISECWKLVILSLWDFEMSK